jgi:adenylylsulfate kinase-like enzyme
MTMLFRDAVLIVLSLLISPIGADRRMVRVLLDTGEIIEVNSSTQSVCEYCDPKGFTKKARQRENKLSQN